MFAEEYTPRHRGFDEHVGYLQGCLSEATHIASCCQPGKNSGDKEFVCDAPKGKDYRGYDWWSSLTADAHGESVPDPTANHSSSASIIGNTAVDFIKRQQNAKEPFFLTLPFQNIHEPYTVEEKYRDLYQSYTNLTQDEITMFGYISEMDFEVGEVVAALKATGAYDNTIIAFTSDNGAPPAGTTHITHTYIPYDSTCFGMSC